jgi:hypothetical protein
MGRFRKWLSVLLTGAIVGACAGLLIKLLGSWLLPEEYWPAGPRGAWPGSARWAQWWPTAAAWSRQASTGAEVRDDAWMLKRRALAAAGGAASALPQLVARYVSTPPDDRGCHRHRRRVLTPLAVQPPLAASALQVAQRRTRTRRRARHIAPPPSSRSMRTGDFMLPTWSFRRSAGSTALAHGGRIF